MRVYFFVLITLFLMPAYADSLYQNPPSEERAWPFTSEIPSCDDFYVLRKVMQDFQNREREYWASDLFINHFEFVKEIGLRNHGQSYTPRRYCQSEGLFGDGVKREVFYNITPDQSVILTGQVIDWCVVGLDRAHIDGPNCRRVTPKYP